MGCTTSVPVFDDIGTEVTEYEQLFLKPRNHIKFTECNLVHSKINEKQNLKLIRNQVVLLDFKYLSCIIEVEWNGKIVTIHCNGIRMEESKYIIGYAKPGRVTFNFENRTRSYRAVFRLRHRKELPNNTYVTVPLQLEIDVFGLTEQSCFNDGYSSIVLAH